MVPYEVRRWCDTAAVMMPDWETRQEQSKHLVL